MKNGTRILLSLLLVVSCNQSGHVEANKNEEPVWKASDKNANPPLVNVDKATALQGSFVELAKKANPAVVNIYTSKKSKMNPFGGRRGMPRGPGRAPGGPMDPNDPFQFFEKFFDCNGPGSPRGDMPEQRSLGSGFVIHPEGFVVTNNHVIDGADEIKVKFGEDKGKQDEYLAELIGKDAFTDIALLKIKGKNFQFLPLGNSDTLQVGEWVMAVGNPFGLGHTVTVGIISAKQRDLQEQLGTPYTNFLQTDAAINPGNSGGPLLNVYGEVIGINAAINAGANNIGFAIPSNLAKRVLTDLQNKGSVTRGWIGVSMGAEVDEKMAKHFGLKEPGGVVIAEVLKGDPADRAGIKAYDVVIEIDGRKIQTRRDLLQTVADIPVGKKVAVKLVRDGAIKTVQLEIAQRKEEQASVQAPGRSQPQADGEKDASLGIEVSDIDRQTAIQLGLPQGTKGVVIVNVDSDSSAAEEGLRPGDVITAVNRKPIDGKKQFLQEVKKSGNSVLMNLVRGGSPVLVVIQKKS